ncbi:elongation factor G [Micromonospora sagamiensis]|uniref:Ribosomal protection tetracycline resistance protein n=1 Tax=Micromonospora sagamiensis TaxID=47875 RepID=A0A562WEG4_9ACTN|nr:TetM/TetW/TetO/TetS family tetracycline resistance ribosomal protection protein [Micromonospora sagamiensis]TWJ27944.1 ribosomal protection tetracycline resistance protein [Micromonospora sagamiensis]BCL13167.1 tetracycline resistance protein, tetM/tetO subfamily [Micromonospora sagamiensis]
MRTLNLGILAHVDAGKTSLTERLLYAAGVIDEIGSVDDGNTQTDTLALERQRGITIRSAVVSFVVGDVTVNLIDTPGHPDFIAEVERVLSVLDGAVLVVSAVEGVQAQTRVLMRTLHRLRIPTLVFVNKVDRAGAQDEALLRSIAERLWPSVVPMGAVARIGTRDASVIPYGAHDVGFRTRLAELLAEHDDALLAAYVRDETSVPYRRLRRQLAVRTGQALVHPVFFGSAITGVGVDPLVTGITELLPATGGDADGPVSGTVFKVERGPAGEKIAYARIFSGTLRVRDRVRLRGDTEGRVTAIEVFDRGEAVPRTSVAAGRIGKLRGLADVRVGDPIGVPPESRPEHHFAPPTLETVVLPRRPADRAALHPALSQLAEQDPLIDLRRDEIRQEITVSLYGEVQKEVIEATLAGEYGVQVTFRESTTVCRERPVGTGAAVEFIGQEPNPFLATVGLRVEPAAAGSGVTFRLGVELGSMPPAFFRAVEETVHRTLQQGLCGWQVTDCVVTMTHSGYWARQSHAHGTFDKSMSSTAGDFRLLTPLVLMSALEQAGTRVYEPVHRFRLEIPAAQLGTVLPALARLGAVTTGTGQRGSAQVLEGEVPAARVHGVEQRLPALTSGEGVWECAFDHYRPVRGEPPVRPRWDQNPLRREEYLLRVVRRVTPP